MSAELDRILKLNVPIIVLMGEKTMPLQDVVSMMPGTIIELPKPADSELELLVNNMVIGSGTAVKVGENFGLRISAIGDARERIAAMATEEDTS
ncbi:MAG: FliM/FliN family flagellar motor C-terminal domain-containing protein, partial [Planctomycetota bacterium]